MNRLLLAAAIAAGCAPAALAGWGDSADQPSELLPPHTNVYATEAQATADGGLWHVYRQTVADDEYDIPRASYQWRIQYFDPQGNPTLGPDGLLISKYRNLSWTQVNSYLSVDRDGNAVVVVPDLRHSPDDASNISATAYLIDRSGKQLWGDEGVSIDDGRQHNYITNLGSLQLEDGSYVFCYQQIDIPAAGSESMAVCLQRVSAKGETMWDHADVDITDPKSNMGTPIIVNAGSNQFYLSYLKGSNQDLMVRKLDFDGSKVWAADTRVYRGGFGSIPVWTFLKVGPAANGGIAFCWYDDRGFTQVEDVYLSVVKSDGSLAFAGASEEGDVRVGYAEQRSLQPNFVSVGDGTYVVTWVGYNANQSFSQLRAQRVSASGELMWDENGAELSPFVQSNAQIGAVLNGAEGQVGVFYLEKFNGYDDARAKLRIIDLTDDTPVYGDDEPAIALTPSPNDYSSMWAVRAADAKCWITGWDRNSIVDKDSQVYQMLRVNFDGTIGPDKSGIAAVGADAANAAVTDVYTLQGVRVAPSLQGLAGGIYIARRADGTATKHIVK